MTTLEAIYEQEHRRSTEGLGAIVWIVFAVLFLLSFLGGVATGYQIDRFW